MDRAEKAKEVKRVVKVGDVLTHTRCMGCLEEHIFTGWDGEWMCGDPAPAPAFFADLSAEPVNDIAPGNVTHINSVPVENVEFLLNVKKERERS